MNAYEWLRSRTPAPPAAMTARLGQSLGAHGSADPSAACLDAGISLLHRLLAGEALGREGAFDLLTADALITYAFEAAAEELEGLDARTTEAMVRLASLARAGETTAA